MNGSVLTDIRFQSGEFSVGGEKIRSYFRPEIITYRLRVAQIALLIYACIWGVDYIAEPKYNLYAAEKLIGSFPVWGAFFLFFGLMGMVGELWMEIGHNSGESSFLCRPENRWWPSFTAHTGLCTMYSMLAVAGIFELIMHAHFYGMRMVGGWVALAVGHWVFIQRRGHAP